MAKSYSGNYSYYRAEKVRQYENQLHQYFEHKKKQTKIENEINRLKTWSAKAHREAGKKGDVKMDTAIKSRINV